MKIFTFFFDRTFLINLKIKEFMAKIKVAEIHGGLHIDYNFTIANRNRISLG